MLVLSRKKSEEILIGDDISIIVVEIRGDKTRLGISAPPELPVHRREVYDAVHRGESRVYAKDGLYLYRENVSHTWALCCLNSGVVSGPWMPMSSRHRESMTGEWEGPLSPSDVRVFQAMRDRGVLTTGGAS